MQFEEAWNFIVERSRKACIPVVQDRTELEYIFNLMKDCKSYLEVGTAEGNSLYVLAHALQEKENIVCVDFGEKHTEPPRNLVIQSLEAKGFDIIEVYGNSHGPEVVSFVPRYKPGCTHFDAVLIDAGHSYEDVIADAVAFGSLAEKYIFFHDIRIPDVNRAFEWYCRQRPECKNYRVVNSENYGYGVIEV